MIGYRHREIFCLVTSMVVHFYLHMDQRVCLAQYCSIFVSTTKRTIEAAVAFESALSDSAVFYGSPEVVLFRSEWLGSKLLL